MFVYFNENELLTACHSSFVPGDSFNSQLLNIIYKIQKSFDKIPPIDVKGNACPQIQIMRFFW